MRVGINDPRNHNAAAEVGGFCAVGYEGFGTGVVALELFDQVRAMTWRLPNQVS